MADYERGDDSHYHGAIEPKDYIMERGMEWWRGQVVKYATRAGSKRHFDKQTLEPLSWEESELRDLGVARFFLELRTVMVKRKIREKAAEHESGQGATKWLSRMFMWEKKQRSPK